MQGDLNVGIFSNEFNTLIKAPKDASGHAFECFVNWVFFISDFFILVDYVLKNNSDHLYKGYQE